MKGHQHIGLIYAASGLSIAILLILGGLYMQKNHEQVQYIDAVEHTYKVLSAISYCEKTLFEAESSQRGYLLTGENNYKAQFLLAVPLTDSTIKILSRLTSDNVVQKTYLFQLKKSMASQIEILETGLLLPEKGPLYFENIRKGAVIMENCRMYMAKMRGEERSLLNKRLQLKDKYQRLNLSFFKAAYITACLICIVAIGIFFRELRIRLKTQQTLKTKINELSNSKQELEEITFAASHDLQEPMRKVRILSTLIAKKFINKINVTDLDIVRRINTITEQMHGQLNDLVRYTNLINPNEKYSDVNLYNVFRDAYNKVFKDENVQFQISPQLPIIYGSAVQLETMLLQLLDNCLKFKAPDRDLIVTITYELILIKGSKYFWQNLSAKEYHQVTITDNGIGFDEQYSDKIFGLFQRLHPQSEYPGKGLGLSVARRVMSNHNGHISAMGEKMTGARFILHFPVEGQA